MSGGHEVLFVLATRIRFMCPMNFAKFPMDDQMCKFQVSLTQELNKVEATRFQLTSLAWFNRRDLERDMDNYFSLFLDSLSPFQ